MTSFISGDVRGGWPRSIISTPLSMTGCEWAGDMTPSMPTSTHITVSKAFAFIAFLPFWLLPREPS